MTEDDEIQISDEQWDLVFDMISLTDLEMACVVVLLSDVERGAVHRAVQRMKATRD
ncbi:hypothetical protein [Streptosporangium sp. NPDC002524]|uniref:hypothetical protein n=1 Tax=Streptosporangium sp. NPDC002524 TaxID=3154537 RepID=UPI00331A14B7